MARKKSFIPENPADLFLSGAGEQPQQPDTAPEIQEPPTIRLPGTEPEQTKPERSRAPRIEIKKKPVNLKTKRFNALFKEDTFERLKTAAEEAGVSANEFLNQLVDQYYLYRAAEREDSQE